MEEALKWWKNLPEYRKKILAEEEHWTTPEKITDHQIKMIFDLFQTY